MYDLAHVLRLALGLVAGCVFDDVPGQIVDAVGVDELRRLNLHRPVVVASDLRAGRRIHGGLLPHSQSIHSIRTEN